RISSDSRQVMEPIARGGRVPGDLKRRSEGFRAEVDAVQFELDTTRGAQARADGDRSGDTRVGGWGRDGHDRAVVGKSLRRGDPGAPQDQDQRCGGKKYPRGSLTVSHR